MGLIARKLHPEWFQGNLRKRYYFEGWYFKIIDKSSDNIYAIIPGVALNKKSQNSHAFIQILNGKTAEYHYIRFPLSDFRAEKDRFAVTIGNNTFSEDHIHLEISDSILVKADLKFTDLIRLRRTVLNPGVMDLYTWLPFMETKHGVVSMNHNVNGSFEINNNHIDFTDGKGYIEKDWGTSFPSNWIWMQSNHFEESNRSFMFSLAKIRYLGIKFTGFLGVLWNKGEILRFGTYTGAKIRNLEIKKTHVKFDIHMKQTILNVFASKSIDESGSTITAKMMTPDLGEMSAKCMESISSTIKLSLYQNKKGKRTLLFQDTGTNTGLEIMGENHDFF
ncbi:MAG: tocopherol cyclase family protein [Promethearchaeota archaeon]